MHKRFQATSLPLISCLFPLLLDFYVFFACLLFFFSGLDIFVGGTFYVGWLIVMAAGSLMHGRCAGIVIPSYVSSPDVLLTAIDFYSFSPSFPAFPWGRLPPPSSLPSLQKRQACKKRRWKAEFPMRVPPFFHSFTFSHFVCIVLYRSLLPFPPFSLLCMRSNVHSAT